jgi:hypothetical protein
MREFASTVNQSSHIAPKGKLRTASAATASHQDRCRTPQKANGRALVLMAMSAAGQWYIVASAKRPTARSTGFQTSIESVVGGHATQMARNGQTSGAGRSRYICHAKATMGNPSQRTAASSRGSTARGANSSSAVDLSRR